MCVLTFTRCHYIYSKLLFHICTIVFTFEHLDAFNVTLDVNYISDFSFTTLKYGEQMRRHWFSVITSTENAYSCTYTLNKCCMKR